ncbi:F-box protein At5g50450 [Elaeis guineensis]|uniref:F-box protein At1g67340 n=1 Tax=Elaeis guineensis var. tenera TaxID=51953 RepID=A0A6I9R467_ELAGV|nr:F-box protein At1g67340 [Elaeis guineensis]
MRTRRGLSSRPKEAAEEERAGGGGKRNRGREHYGRRKRPRAASPAAEGDGGGGAMAEDLFDILPDEIIVLILGKIVSSASSPSDLISILITCRRANRLGMSPFVLSKASAKIFAIRAKNWSDSAHKFLKQSADAGNLEASYILGMIRFYCLESRASGVSLVARAAIGSHMAALYALAVIQFNGSGGSKHDKDLRAGVALCARAAALGHVDALRELGHCLQDGYGVRQNVVEGRRFLVQANAHELAVVLGSTAKAAWQAHRHHRISEGGSCCSLLSDFGCNVPAPEAHPANRFMVEWFAMRGGPSREGLRMCSYGGCGRPETRRHEFRRCSVCGTVNYCSRACQALHWKLAHKTECAPVDGWLDAPVGAAGGGGGAGGGAPRVNGGVGLVNY